MMTKKLYKKVEYNDFLDFNPRTYPCVRDWPVYQVKAKDFVEMFSTETSPGRGVGTPNEEGDYKVARGDGSGYLGAKEFDSLRADSRAHLPPLRKGGTPLVILNGVPVPYSTTIDLNRAWGWAGLELKP
jgi:hypothetical protein